MIYDLDGDLVLGRGEQAQIRLEDPFASSAHARLYEQGNVVVVEDLGSTNGTYLNEELLQSARPLHPGDRGHTVRSRGEKAPMPLGDLSGREAKQQREHRRNRVERCVASQPVEPPPPGHRPGPRSGELGHHRDKPSWGSRQSPARS